MFLLSTISAAEKDVQEAVSSGNESYALPLFLVSYSVLNPSPGEVPPFCDLRDPVTQQSADPSMNSNFLVLKSV